MCYNFYTFQTMMAYCLYKCQKHQKTVDLQLICYLWVAFSDHFCLGCLRLYAVIFHIWCFALHYSGNYQLARPYESGATCGDCPNDCNNKLCSKWQMQHWKTLGNTMQDLLAAVCKHKGAETEKDDYIFFFMSLNNLNTIFLQIRLCPETSQTQKVIRI